LLASTSRSAEKNGARGRGHTVTTEFSKGKLYRIHAMVRRISSRHELIVVSGRAEAEYPMYRPRYRARKQVSVSGHHGVHYSSSELLAASSILLIPRRQSHQADIARAVPSFVVASNSESLSSHCIREGASRPPINESTPSLSMLWATTAYEVFLELELREGFPGCLGVSGGLFVLQGF